ncbi:choice-of-anchor J domain-containing protein [Paucibacter sp. DJ1R-11]|uniref:choice-of-anchor J family PEP-CTERM protein n=1 Tax=Paucibacter sp. DJ1R-11 TaxID=2893556 RepID=UPI0021E42BEF|nr:choice-of-anchor J domain-containing protein [Paucibacter sp. DJ1R-11]MCV2366081.1 choice-of-anchor J domain-containing protein [Paucibacter sp. DJ1R-11]
MKLAKKCLLGLAGMTLAIAAQADTYTEGFDDLAASGWTLSNNSSPAGLAWFQGVPEYFAAQSGAAGSYAAATYASTTTLNGSISNWLISPELILGGAGSLSFFARTGATEGFSDTVKVYFNAGADAATASFTNLLGTVTLSTSGWTQYTIALPNAATGRIAFEYAVGDAATANLAAIDSVSVSAVPEPTSFALMGLGVLGLAFLRRRQD